MQKKRGRDAYFAGFVLVLLRINHPILHMVRCGLVHILCILQLQDMSGRFVLRAQYDDGVGRLVPLQDGRNILGLKNCNYLLFANSKSPLLHL